MSKSCDEQNKIIWAFQPSVPLPLKKTNKQNLHNKQKQKKPLHLVFPYTQDSYIKNCFSGHDRQEELARILAMIDPALGPPNRPLLVLSCVSHVGVERIPCVYVAHQLQLNVLHQPWMVLAFRPYFLFLSGLNLI